MVISAPFNFLKTENLCIAFAVKQQKNATFVISKIIEKIFDTNFFMIFFWHIYCIKKLSIK